eukprot:GHVU01216050.1.p1 GENE.GHVU01216050.1~~GHVU01216050.1.p1  ORF type:complete len:118 (-),score=10.53 GHVU01216050.1:80-433(-)
MKEAMIYIYIYRKSQESRRDTSEYLLACARRAQKLLWRQQQRHHEQRQPTTTGAVLRKCIYPLLHIKDAYVSHISKSLVNTFVLSANQSRHGSRGSSNHSRSLTLHYLTSIHSFTID